MPNEAKCLMDQLCFPLYACARGVVKKYTPFLDELGLTYTQYITMMVLWEQKRLKVKELGEALFLDSGTLTPLLKKLEADGLLTRKRDCVDERCVSVELTQKGIALQQKAEKVPGRVSCCFPLSDEDSAALHRILLQILQSQA